MTLRRRILLYYSVTLSLSLVIVGFWSWFEFEEQQQVIIEGGIMAALEESPVQEALEIIVLGGLPAILLGIVGGGLLMRRALLPIEALTEVLEKTDASNLSYPVARSGNGDELDRMTAVFNGMKERLGVSFTQAREFTLHASHELKTPLTAILGYAELLREELVADGHTLGADGAATIEESGRKLLGIVESILEIAKLQSGAVRFHPDRVSLTRIVEEVADAFYSRAREKGLEFSFHRADNEARTTVWADAERVKQALEHLLDNAVKFTSQGSVEITLVPGDEQVT
ncbi:MAG: HAMP domain-containing histidine kinase, partial [Verrucomicrobiales bacterium]|nr:HAMP domain-containing histidine kinase [Verrucomicrobiales bacterium]